MALPSLMQDKAILDTQRVTAENTVKQTEIMQRVFDSIANQRKEFNEYRKDFSEFRKSIIRGNDDRKSLTSYIQNIKTTNYTADKAKGKDNSTDFLKGALGKLIGAKNDGSTQIQQKIAEDTRITRDYSVRAAASLAILAESQSDDTRTKERELLATAIADKINAQLSGLEDSLAGLVGNLGKGLVAALAAAGTAIVGAVSAVGVGLLGKLGLAAGAAMIPGNIGQDKDPMGQANEEAELARRRQMMPEHLKPNTIDQSGRRTSISDPRIPSNQPQEKEPSLSEKFGGAGEIIAGSGLMFMKRNPILAATMTAGGLGLKLAAGESVKPEDAGINASKQAREAELKRTEDSSKNSRLRRFAEANSLKEMKDALFGADKETLDARDKEKSTDKTTPKVEVKPIPESSKLKAAPDKIEKVQAVQDQSAMATILKEQQDMSKALEAETQSAANQVTVNNINTNNVSGGSGGSGVSFQSVATADNDPVVQFYQKFKNSIPGIN